MFDWGILKCGVPKSVLHWRPPDVHIFHTDPSLVEYHSFFRFLKNIVSVKVLELVKL